MLVSGLTGNPVRFEKETVPDFSQSLQGCHRSGNDQEKKIHFESEKINILKNSQGKLK